MRKECYLLFSKFEHAFNFIVYDIHNFFGSCQMILLAMIALRSVADCSNLPFACTQLAADIFQQQKKLEMHLNYFG